jgi:hypothetical protein
MKNLLSIVIVIFLVSCERRLEFDKNYWKNHPNERCKMADDIVKTKMLIGKNKQDVRVLLTEDCKYCDDTSDNWMYYLGEGFNKLDRKWEILDVEFQDGKVVSVSIR